LVAASLASALACHDTTSPALEVTLAAQLGTKSEFFEDEPIYVAFSLTNHGSDTIWTGPFSFVLEWFIDGDVTDSAGTPLDKWGGYGSVGCGPDLCAEPLPPGRSRYDVRMIQDRWGQYRADMQYPYDRHHLSPGKYTLRIHFDARRPGSRFALFLNADSVTFRVRPQTTAEGQSLQRLQSIFAMAAAVAVSRDTTELARFDDSLVANVLASAPDDPIVPLVITTFGVGFLMDSTKRDALVNATIDMVRAQRRTAGGAYALAMGLNQLRPSAIPALAQELDGSLAGDVAVSIAEGLTRY
jgi:hypothetical protein